MLKKLGKKKTILLLISAALVFSCVACLIALNAICRKQQSQFEYERWRGGNDAEYAQLSCFMNDSDSVDLNKIFSFRGEIMKKLAEASIDTETKQFIDAWSCSGSAKISSDSASTKASVTAVGGEFFAFHPFRLLSGNYFSESNLMKDGVIIDEELAWLLFGSNNVTGMRVKVENLSLTVAGVIERDSDKASKKAYSGGMGFFMSYDAYSDMLKGDSPAAAQSTSSGGAGNAEGASVAAPGSVSSPAVTCYELCLPNPVKGFASGFVQEKFPKGTGLIIENSGRFSPSKLLRIAFSSSSRAMGSGVPYPYWENAARYTESKAAMLLVAAIFSAVFPLVFAGTVLFHWAVYGKNALSKKIPEWKEKAEEAIRVRQRKHWEKTHPNQK